MICGKIIPYGFEYGAAKITRCMSDNVKGWVVLELETPRHKGATALQIYVTKTGKVRIIEKHGEWTRPTKSMKRKKVC